MEPLRGRGSLADAQDRPDRADALQRHRQRLLRRDPPSRAALAGQADLTADESRTLFEATRQVLEEWTDRLRADVGEGFPDQGVTAFREGMAVHGRYKQPCPDCGSPVQRIVRGDHETNYCATCQTDGKLLADRALSKLLKGDWPRTLEELEERLPGRGRSGPVGRAPMGPPPE